MKVASEAQVAAMANPLVTGPMENPAA